MFLHGYKTTNDTEHYQHVQVCNYTNLHLDDKTWYDALKMNMETTTNIHYILLCVYKKYVITILFQSTIQLINKYYN